MKAKFVRGQDPKDALGIGDEDLRKFNKALGERDYYASVLDSMIDGLTSGSIKERDAIRFVEGGIAKHYPRRTLLWFKWYNDFNHTFWGEDIEKFIITFNLPDIEFHGDVTNRTLRCEINKFVNEGAEPPENHYEISSWIQVSQLGDETSEAHFHINNVFYPDDSQFNMHWVVNSISRTIEAAIKNMG